jgi:hypothetical protein
MQIWPEYWAKTNNSCDIYWIYIYNIGKLWDMELFYHWYGKWYGRQVLFRHGNYIPTNYGFYGHHIMYIKLWTSFMDINDSKMDTIMITIDCLYGH